jgi:hypothetical protein
MVILISLTNAYGQNESQKELYRECVNVAGKSLCDFLFIRNGANTTSNLTDMSQFNITKGTNSTSGMTLNTSSESISNPLNSSFLRYNDNDLGFSIPYPSDWTVNTKNSQSYTVISFFSPDNNATVDVRVFPKGVYKSTKDAGDKLFKESEDNTLLAYYRNSSTLLSGKPAFKAIYLTTYNPSLFENAFGYKSYTSKAMMTGTMVPDKKSLYALAYFANGENFDYYRPVVEKMIESFKISGKGPIIQEDNSSSSLP